MAEDLTLIEVRYLKEFQGDLIDLMDAAGEGTSMRTCFSEMMFKDDPENGDYQIFSHYVFKEDAELLRRLNEWSSIFSYKFVEEEYEELPYEREVAALERIMASDAPEFMIADAELRLNELRNAPQP